MVVPRSLKKPYISKFPLFRGCSVVPVVNLLLHASSSFDINVILHAIMIFIVLMLCQRVDTIKRDR